MFTVPENVHSYSARKGLQLRFTENVHGVRKCTVSEKGSELVLGNVHSARKCSRCQKMFTVPEMFTVSAGKGLQLRFTVPEKVHSVRNGSELVPENVHSAGKCSQCQKIFTVPERFTVPENVHMQCLKMFTVPEKVHSARKGS